MPNDLPSFLRPAAAPVPSFLAPKVPDWLRGSPKRDPTTRTPQGNGPETQALILAQFELAFPRILDRMCSGETLNKVLDDFPIPVDRGAFMRWIKKDATRFALYKEAKEIRTEIWTGEMIDIASGEKLINGMEVTLDRSKFLVETYKWLIKSDNKRDYGDTKQIEVNQTISIVAALQAAETRIERIIELPDDDEPEPTFKQISAAIDAEWEDDDE